MKKYEEYLREHVREYSRCGGVELPCEIVLDIADWIEKHRNLDESISEYGMTREAEKRVIDNARYEICRAQRETIDLLDPDLEEYDCEDADEIVAKPSTFWLIQNIIAQGTRTAGGTSCWKEIYAIEEECGKFGDTD